MQIRILSLFAYIRIAIYCEKEVDLSQVCRFNEDWKEFLPKGRETYSISAIYAPGIVCLCSIE